MALTNEEWMEMFYGMALERQQKYGTAALDFSLMGAGHSVRSAATKLCSMDWISQCTIPTQGDHHTVTRKGEEVALANARQRNRAKAKKALAALAGEDKS